MQLLQGQSLEVQEFVSSRNTWLESEYFGKLLKTTFVLNLLFSQRMKKGWYPPVARRIWKTFVSWQTHHLKYFLVPRSDTHRRYQPVSLKCEFIFSGKMTILLFPSIFYSSAPINELMTNPKMVPSENSCHQYLHQDQNPNHTFFFFCLASMDKHIST